jgi:hypothetical protein
MAELQNPNSDPASNSLANRTSAKTENDKGSSGTALETFQKDGKQK